MFWGCFAASGTGCLESVRGIMKSENYQGILERNILPTVTKLHLCRSSLSSRTTTQNTHQKAPRNGPKQNTGLF
ncbi:hypothetical protein LDENG_00275940 [Lucifuga dentata]|nr:hypothetical protein LDENG_00275940 [Lucifuga dentata]